jgi:hypothetical protein
MISSSSWACTAVVASLHVWLRCNMRLPASQLVYVPPANCATTRCTCDRMTCWHVVVALAVPGATALLLDNR